MAVHKSIVNDCRAILRVPILPKIGPKSGENLGVPSSAEKPSPAVLALPSVQAER